MKTIRNSFAVGFCFGLIGFLICICFLHLQPDYDEIHHYESRMGNNGSDSKIDDNREVSYITGIKMYLNSDDTTIDTIKQMLEINFELDKQFVNSLSFEHYYYDCGIRDGEFYCECFLPSGYQTGLGLNWKTGELPDSIKEASYVRQFNWPAEDDLLRSTESFDRVIHERNIDLIWYLSNGSRVYESFYGAIAIIDPASYRLFAYIYG